MGALSGYRFIEMAGLGPAPFCGMMLADMGAEVIRITRKPGHEKPLIDEASDILNRGRVSLELNLKNARDKEIVHELICKADGLIEGYRPGVMERLGLGPKDCMTLNPGLVFGRVTGWGQDGPLAGRVGHDINYLGLSGALSAIGRKNSGPLPPLNLVADFGGGGMLLTVGMLSALLEKRTSGRGQVVDAAMIDGCALQLAMILSLRNMGTWRNERESNLLDGGAPFYSTYECADGRYMAVGAIEPDFYRVFLRVCGIDDAVMQAQWRRDLWPVQKEIVAKVFLRKTRESWTRLFEEADACVTPVLELDEAPAHEHNRARATYSVSAAGISPGAAPRFSRTGSLAGAPDDSTPERCLAVLAGWGVSQSSIAHLGGS
ncbi:conserved hypothetical protein [Paraburkholderia piptadeniae]|uniref:CoA transferase n=2 Tax=Paraburkholderia TaxID=1822464 RepID=A0A7X1TGU7_9BURK|nr:MULTISPECIES: CaiB/BaiF CoA-transferase family protein [Paraburkholderia]MPW18733.1 CoA transferase [Paraburkholderia franconis]SIT48296.1 conserved hypothetical protein [Paraburkholderia piptadeniae]